MNRKLVLVFLTIALLSFFIFLRLYKIQQSIEFYGDIGRDHEKLMVWLQGGKPPLIGPNTILKIVNQSPWFYYLNFPIFIISKSALAMTYTLTLLMVASFLISIYVLRNSKFSWNLFPFFYLISIHPLIVEQQRTPWNPTFSIPFLFVSIALLVRIFESQNRFLIFLFTFFLSIALGMTYSIFWVFAVLSIIAYVFLKKENKIWFFISYGISLFLIFAPLALFEIKSGFFLLHRLNDIKIPAIPISFQDKMIQAVSVIFTGSTQEGKRGIILLLCVVATAIAAIIFVKKKNPYLQIGLAAAIPTGVLTLLMPFSQPYYLFGVMLVIFFLISVLDRRITVLLLLVFSVLWFQPKSVSRYMKTAIRMLPVLEKCTRTFCEKHPGQYYVSANTWYGSHSAHDHAFLFNMAGCKSRDIVSFPGFKTNQMVVVADNASFKPYVDSFYELEQLGKYQVKSLYHCTDTLSYFLLKKN